MFVVAGQSLSASEARPGRLVGFHVFSLFRSKTKRIRSWLSNFSLER